MQQFGIKPSESFFSPGLDDTVVKSEQEKVGEDIIRKQEGLIYSYLYHQQLTCFR